MMILKKVAANQVFQRFVLVGSHGFGTTSINHQCAMPPLLRNYVAICYAPYGSVHPSSASLYSGYSLAFAFPLLQSNRFLWHEVSVAPDYLLNPGYRSDIPQP
jgi:hypothetical protein